MSLTSSYSPKLSMAKSFGSHLALAEAREEKSSYQYQSEEKKVEYGETSPLVANKGDESRAQLNATLLTTIFAITVGSSFQFGYATGTSRYTRGSISC
jgi:hypothetical protein